IHLNQLIENALLEQKAKSLGISKDELLKREVDDKVQAPSEDVVKQYYERVKSQGTYEDLAPRIRQILSGPQMAQRRAEYLASLRKEAEVKFELPPPRVKVATTGGYEKRS
ncbi:MAG: hypothetical protein ACREQY_06665, partial [Candidatus Binatia bacterium]